jgi:hypothetical protein
MRGPFSKKGMVGYQCSCAHDAKPPILMLWPRQGLGLLLVGGPTQQRNTPRLATLAVTRLNTGGRATASCAMACTGVSEASSLPGGEEGRAGCGVLSGECSACFDRHCPGIRGMKGRAMATSRTRASIVLSNSTWCRPNTLARTCSVSWGLWPTRPNQSTQRTATANQDMPPQAEIANCPMRRICPAWRRRTAAQGYHGHSATAPPRGLLCTHHQPTRTPARGARALRTSGQGALNWPMRYAVGCLCTLRASASGALRLHFTPCWGPARRPALLSFATWRHPPHPGGQGAARLRCSDQRV